MVKKPKAILVPVDFKEPSIKAVQYAYNLAECLNSDLILLNVIETPGWLSEFFTKGDELVRITDQAKEKLLKIAVSAEKKNAGVKITTRVERGKPYQEILEIANSKDVRMIILGENHCDPKKDEDLGSTVYHVTLKSPVPVITQKGDFLEKGDKIIVPLDLTQRTRRQLLSAIANGEIYDAQIHLVSVLIGGIEMKDSRIFKKLQQARTTLKENGIDCSIKLFERSDSPPYKKVLEYAENIKAGMILLMTHQEGYTYDNYIGAFAHHIINESRIPVMSLTATATKIDNNQAIKGIVDPLGMLFK